MQGMMMVMVMVMLVVYFFFTCIQSSHVWSDREMYEYAFSLLLLSLDALVWAVPWSWARFLAEEKIY